MKNTILIATTNAGKFEEITSYFNDLKFVFKNLKDLDQDKEELEEPFSTTEENALHKARYYAMKTNFLTIAEDTGFFVNFLNGEPGVKAKRFAKTAQERNEKIISLLKNATNQERNAFFETSLCLYNPQNDCYTLFKGKVEGQITKEAQQSFRNGMGYDSIFYYPPLNKTFANLTVAEKNSISHRGLALNQAKIFLENQFNFKQIIVPLALIVKNRKLFLNQRRDVNPEFNNKWEFPGGGIDNGESVIDCLKREVKEETGLTIEPLELLPKIYSHKTESETRPYQVFLIIYVCKTKDEQVIMAEEESINFGWFSYEESIHLDLLPLNKECIQENSAILKKYID